MENRCDHPCDLFYMISGWKGALPEDIGYFHAAYRQEHLVQKGRSYVVLDGVEGRGRFLGMTLAVGVNGHNTCWVEGEAKMYIDGESRPSMNYTGTENYFCRLLWLRQRHRHQAISDLQCTLRRTVCHSWRSAGTIQRAEAFHALPFPCEG